MAIDGAYARGTGEFVGAAAVRGEFSADGQSERINGAQNTKRTRLRPHLPAVLWQNTDS